MHFAYNQCQRSTRHPRPLASRVWDADLPVPATPAIAEQLVQQIQEEQMVREAMTSLSPQCRRLVELLFFETPARPYNEIARELGLAVGSIGFTRQKCIDRLRARLDQLGYR